MKDHTEARRSGDFPMCRAHTCITCLSLLTHPTLCFLSSSLAICFKMLRDIGTSDLLQIKYITKKIKKMAQRSPNLVMETLYDFFKDNPEVVVA